MQYAPRNKKPEKEGNYRKRRALEGEEEGERGGTGGNGHFESQFPPSFFSLLFVFVFDKRPMWHYKLQLQLQQDWKLRAKLIPVPKKQESTRVRQAAYIHCSPSVCEGQ